MSLGVRHGQAASKPLEQVVVAIKMEDASDPADGLPAAGTLDHDDAGAGAGAGATASEREPEAGPREPEAGPAPLSGKNNKGMCVFVAEMHQGKVRLVKKAVEAGTKGSKDDFRLHGTGQRTPEDGVPATVLQAAEEGHVEALQRLLAENGDPNQSKPRAATTAVMLAAHKGHATCVQCLLDHGADPARQDDTDGLTALMLACSVGGKGNAAAAEAIVVSVPGLACTMVTVAGACACQLNPQPPTVQQLSRWSACATSAPLKQQEPLSTPIRPSVYSFLFPRCVSGAPFRLWARAKHTIQMRRASAPPLACSKTRRAGLHSSMPADVDTRTPHELC